MSSFLKEKRIFESKGSKETIHTLNLLLAPTTFVHPLGPSQPILSFNSKIPLLNPHSSLSLPCLCALSQGSNLFLFSSQIIFGLHLPFFLPLFSVFFAKPDNRIFVILLESSTFIIFLSLSWPCFRQPLNSHQCTDQLMSPHLVFSIIRINISVNFSATLFLHPPPLPHHFSLTFGSTGLPKCSPLFLSCRSASTAFNVLAQQKVFLFHLFVCFVYTFCFISARSRQVASDFLSRRGGGKRSNFEPQFGSDDFLHPRNNTSMSVNIAQKSS